MWLFYVYLFINKVYFLLLLYNAKGNLLYFNVYTC